MSSSEDAAAVDWPQQTLRATLESKHVSLKHTNSAIVQPEQCFLLSLSVHILYRQVADICVDGLVEEAAREPRVRGHCPGLSALPPHRRAVCVSGLPHLRVRP